MKIQFASDLHLEFISASESSYTGIAAAPDADVLVLAGDIHNGTAGIEVFKVWPMPIVYVSGNHDVWGCADLDERMAEMRQACTGTSIHFLEKDAIVIDGVRFLGTTLWTDYLLFGFDVRPYIMDYCGRSMNDHSRINVAGNGITPLQLLTRHEASVAWLTAQLAQPFDGKTVVVTHHAPHLASVVSWHKSEYLVAAYASDLMHLMDVPTLWLHGHVHVSVDYCVRNTRIASNPRGYPRHPSNNELKNRIKFQNHDFDPQKTIELNEL